MLEEFTNKYSKMIQEKNANVISRVLLGQLIPDVYINGITLETGEEPLVDNPHIDDERENAES